MKHCWMLVAALLMLTGCGASRVAQPTASGSPSVPAASSFNIHTSGGTTSGSVQPTASTDVGRWQETTPLIDGYQGAALVTLADGRALVAGGWPTGSQISAATVEIYDPQSGAWTLAASMETSRANFSAARLPNGRVLVAGGFGPDGHRTATSEVYDPVANHWSYTGAMIVGRVNEASTALADGRVLVVGGRIPTGPIAAAEIYDPSSGRWSRVSSMSTPRESPTATLLAGGRVLVTGGRTADSALLNATSSAELFDPASGQWSAAASMSVPRAYHTATRLSDGRVLVTGGAENDSPLAEVYDPKANAWTDAGETPGDGSPASRNDAAAISLPDGKVLVVGGYTSYPSGFRSAIIFDPQTSTWSLAGQVPGAHPVASAAILPDDRVLVVGGSAAADIYTEAPQ